MGLGDRYFTRDWLSSHHVRGIFHEPCLLLFMLAATAWPGLCLSDFCVKSSAIQTTLCRKQVTRQEHTQAPLPPDSICINCFHSCNTDTLQTPDSLFSCVLHPYGLRDIYFIPWVMIQCFYIDFAGQGVHWLLYLFYIPKLLLLLLNYFIIIIITSVRGVTGRPPGVGSLLPS